MASIRASPVGRSSQCSSWVWWVWRVLYNGDDRRCQRKMTNKGRSAAAEPPEPPDPPNSRQGEEVVKKGRRVGGYSPHAPRSPAVSLLRGAGQQRLPLTVESTQGGLTVTTPDRY